MPGSEEEYFDEVAAAIRLPRPPAAPALFEGAGRNIEAGLAIYRNNVRSSLSRALGERFPIIEKLVGAVFFKALANEFFNAHPPISPLISRYGDDLPAFLENFEQACAHPYLADVARLEIAWLEAYHAADGEPVSPAIIAGAEDPAQIRFALHPSLRLISSPFPVATIWRRNRDGVVSGKNSVSGGESVLIIRPQSDVIVHVLGAGSHRAISELSRGAAVEDALGAAMACDPAFNAQHLFETLFKFEIIIGAQPGEAVANQSERSGR